MLQTHAGHPDPALLEAFFQGRLSDGEQSSIEEHVSRCSECCQQGNAIPEDRLAQLARAAHQSPAETAVSGRSVATDKAGGKKSARGRPSEEPSTKVESAEQLPPELRDHPRYRIEEVVGRGGMGVVYRAEHRMMRRPVALKVIHPKFVSQSDAIERFHQEVRAAARLSHPNIVTAHDAEQAGDLHFLVMEYVDGCSLAQWVKRRGALSVTQACNAIRQVCLGLQHAHDQGMIHRDIKPQNLMLSRSGRVKILDFGLARLGREPSIAAENTPTPSDLTAFGVMLGTPDYMAPEQASNPRGVDGRTDLFAVGCTLYYLLTGRSPFEAGSFKAMVIKGTERPVTSLSELRPDLPAGLVAIVERLMATDPAERFPSAKEVAAALLPFAKSSPGGEAKLPGSASQDVWPILDPDALPDSGKTPLIRTADRRPAKSHSGLSALSRKAWIGLGTATLLVIILAAIVQSSLGPVDEPQLPVSAAGVGADFARSRELAKTKSTGGARVVPSRDTSIASTAAPSPGANRPARVLFLLPAFGFWWPDYEPVRRTLEEAGHRVIVTASQPIARPSPEGGGNPVTVDVLLNDVQAKDYDALVVGGGFGAISFIRNGQDSAAARRVVQEMHKGNRFVTALCMGPIVLADNGLLDGIEATGHTEIRGKCREFYGLSLGSQPVVRSGRIITGRDDQVAEQFAQTLVQALAERP